MPFNDDVRFGSAPTDTQETLAQKLAQRKLQKYRPEPSIPEPMPQPIAQGQPAPVAQSQVQELPAAPTAQPLSAPTVQDRLKKIALSRRAIGI